MIPYYFYFIITALFSLKPFKFDQTLERYAWVYAITFGAFFIGLRHEVGGDWLNYIAGLQYLDRAPASVWLDFQRFDPGYQVLQYLVSKIGLGIYGINIVCGFIVMLCLAFFAKKQPYPWITMLVAIPFFIIGINMGTVRQGLALSLSLVALTQLNKSSVKFIGWILFAFLFHKSVIVMAGLVILKKINFKLILFLLVFAYPFFLLVINIEAIEILIRAYFIKPDYQSDGAIYRIAVSIVPALASFIYFKELRSKFSDSWIYTYIAIATFALLFFLESYSTLADRLAYYTIPLQLAIWPRIISIQTNALLKEFITISIILGYFFMLFVWLNFANHSWAWIPYQIIWFGVFSDAPETLCLHGSCI